MAAHPSEESNEPREVRDVSATSPGPSPEADAVEALDVPPMTFSLLGRFFAVPLLIIGSIVGGAILVVVLFGGPAAPQQNSIDRLLQVLEAGSGERSMGLLMPREKELWQAGLELSVRLENKDRDAELAAADLASIAMRVGAMVQKDLDLLARRSTTDGKSRRQWEMRSRRFKFLLLALGRTGRSEAVEPLLAVLKRGEESHRTAACQALGYLYELPEARAASGAIAEALRSAESPETQLMACTVLSVLAAPGDASVIEALQSAYRAAEGEVEWNCALALARLGSDVGKSTLLDLLDRSFLESGERYAVKDDRGVVHRHRLPPARVDALLIAAMEAASRIEDDEVWTMIETLASSDQSPAVRGRALAIVKAHNG